MLVALWVSGDLRVPHLHLGCQPSDPGPVPQGPRRSGPAGWGLWVVRCFLFPAIMLQISPRTRRGVLSGPGLRRWSGGHSGYTDILLLPGLGPPAPGLRSASPESGWWAWAAGGRRALEPGVGRRSPRDKAVGRRPMSKRSPQTQSGDKPGATALSGCAAQTGSCCWGWGPGTAVWEGGPRPRPAPGREQGWDRPQ